MCLIANNVELLCKYATTDHIDTFLKWLVDFGQLDEEEETQRQNNNNNNNNNHNSKCSVPSRHFLDFQRKNVTYQSLDLTTVEKLPF